MKIKYKGRLFLLTTFLFLSGLSIYALKYWFPIETEYGLRNNPLVDEVKLLHYFFGYFFLISMGILYNTHVKKALKVKNLAPWKKNTGVLLLLLSAVSSLSAPFLLYLTNEAALDTTELIHLYSGIGFVLVLILHYKIAKEG